MTTMADQSPLKGANTQMLKTVGLLAAAIILGVVLINITDSGKVSTNKQPVTSTTKKSTSTTQSGDVTTTTVKKSGITLKPAEVRVIVLNGSGVSGVAGNVSKAIKKKGYTNQPQANTLKTTRTGSAVQCKSGLTEEAKALAIQVANKSKVEPFPSTLPVLKTGAVDANVQCIVIIGK